MPKMSPYWAQEYEDAAYHEAGHAYVFEVYGIGQHGITLNYYRGLFRGEGITALTLVTAEEKDMAHPHLLAVAILAGAMAEAIHKADDRHGSFRFWLDETMHGGDADVDMRQLKECLRQGSISESRVISRTRWLLERKWRKVNTIATQAIKKGGLTERQVRRYAGRL